MNECARLMICFPGVFEEEQSGSSMDTREALLQQQNNIGGWELMYNWTAARMWIKLKQQ